jgi:LAS superfamily LD-carboxypeptidase LdcB
MDPAILTGRTESHLCSASEAKTVGAPVHHDVVAPFTALREEARQAGFEVEIVSGFRGFDRQLSIWNRKADGDLAVLDSAAVPLDIRELSDEELAFAILRWSALPGASRHHWGTELDVIDAAARPEGYEVQLVPEEVDPGGMFGPFHDWLDGRIRTGTSFGFFRPYDRDRGGVAPERWHLSCAPVSGPLLGGLTVGVLRTSVQIADMRLKETVLAHLDEIYDRFVLNIGAPAS